MIYTLRDPGAGGAISWPETNRPNNRRSSSRNSRSSRSLWTELRPTQSDTRLNKISADPERSQQTGNVQEQDFGRSLLTPTNKGRPCHGRPGRRRHLKDVASLKDVNTSGNVSRTRTQQSNKTSMNRKTSSTNALRRRPAQITN